MLSKKKEIWGKFGLNKTLKMELYNIFWHHFIYSSHIYLPSNVKISLKLLMVD